MPTHNKHIFVRPKKVCLFWEMCLLWENVLILSVLIMSGESTVHPPLCGFFMTQKTVHNSGVPKSEDALFWIFFLLKY